MNTLRLLLPLIFAVAATAQEHAHPHDDAPAAAAPLSAGPIRLTETMARNLDLQTVAAELRPIEKTFAALGVVEPEPGQVAAITSRVPGRITRLAVRDGQRVRAGDFLLEVESRVAAETPPRLAFRAPIDGHVLETAVRLGDAVDPDRVLLTLINLDEVDVVARVFEGQLAAVQPGQTVRIRTLAYPDEIFTGRVKNTATGLDPQSATLRVFVHAENPSHRLLPGMRARLAFVAGESESAVVVPRDALHGEGADLFVFREVANARFTYERTPVVVGLRDDRHIEIIDGVLPGDRVVTRGGYQLQFVGGAAAKIEDDHGHSHGPGGHQH